LPTLSEDEGENEEDVLASVGGEDKTIFQEVRSNVVSMPSSKFNRPKGAKHYSYVKMQATLPDNPPKSADDIAGIQERDQESR
jgi:hypothetical protein